MDISDIYLPEEFSAKLPGAGEAFIARSYEFQLGALQKISLQEAGDGRSHVGWWVEAATSAHPAPRVRLSSGLHLLDARVVVDLVERLGALDLPPGLPLIPPQVDDILNHETQARLHVEMAVRGLSSLYVDRL